MLNPKPKFESKLVPPDKRQEFMTMVRERFTFAQALDCEDKKLAADDAEFCLAEPRTNGGTTQWNAEAAQKRVALRRPCLTENRLQVFTAQVVNDGRQSNPAIKITAMDGGTKDTAEYFQGRIRQVEYDCNAGIAYDSAREQQVTCGRAFVRITWDYEYRSFKKQIKIKRIDNQFSVVFGPALEYDCSDADYAFVINAISKDEHKRKYGEATTAALTDFASPSNPAPGWFGVGPNAEMVQEAEYWEKTYKDRKLALLSNGKVAWEDELPDNLEELRVTVEETRTEKDYQVVQYIVDGADILGETVFIGEYIPIVPQWGREYFLDGRRRTISLIRYAKDPQRLLNLYVSNIAEQIAMMPKTPFWVPVGGLPSGLQAEYGSLNDEPRSYILYNQIDPQHPNVSLSPPHREVNEPPIVALVAGYNQCVDAIKASMGIYDASLGNRSNETSAIGITTRQHQSDRANFHFQDNEARTRNHIGRIMLPLIKEMDKIPSGQASAEHAIRSEDGKTRLVTIGKKWRDDVSGKIVHYDIESGNYGVSVETGPSYTSKREEAFASYWEMFKESPGLITALGPTIFRTCDLPGSDQIADILEKMMPPEIRPQPAGGAPQIPPQVQQQLSAVQQRASAVIEGLTSRVAELEQELQGRMMEIESKERISTLSEETKRLIAAAQLGQKEGLTLLMTELQSIKHRLDFEDAERDREMQGQQAELDRKHQAALAAQQPPAAPPDQPTAPPDSAPPNGAPPPPAAPAPAEQPTAPQGV